MRAPSHSTPATEGQPRALPGPWLSQLPTPALVIDLGSCRRNIAATATEIGSTDRWRPHVKTAKVPEVMALYLDAGIERFKCATLLEARTLARTRGGADEAAKDILLAHHLFGPSREGLADLCAEFRDTRFSTLVESVDETSAFRGPIGLFIDLDLGMGRTGISVERTSEVVEIARAAGPLFRGLHAYDGHRHEEDPGERERAAHRGHDQLAALCEALGAAGLRPGEVITSGTPSYPAALSHRGLARLPHRVSPGTVIYHDLRTRDQLPGSRIEFAASVVSRVVSLPGSDLYTVDAGSKAIEASDGERIARSLERPGDIALRQSEEHTVLRVAPGVPRPERGTILRLVPGHVCPTVNLASSCWLVDDGAPIGSAQVAARGH